MLKKVISAILSTGLLLSLFSCGPGTEGETESTAGETVDIARDVSRMDHNIQGDYQNITPSGEHDVRILFVNAGKADAMLFEIDGKYYMVDTGTTDSVPAVLTAMAYMNCTALDGMFITHSHNDHVGGADEICAVFPVGTYYTPAISMDMQKISACAELYNLEHVKLEPGECVELADGVYFEIFGPYRYNPLDDNNNSLVMKLRVNGVSVLLASDMLFDEEKTLMKQDFDLSCDILKAGHHGRKDATSTSFIEATSPETVIFSTDSEEEPGSPHESILAAFEEIGADIHVTQDYDVGILVNIAKDGTYTIEDAHIQNEPEAELKIVSASKEEQTVVIRNTGARDADISRYFLFSERGSEIYVFPEGSVIPAGEEIIVACAGSGIDTEYRWDETKVWNKNKDDTAILYDRYGNILDEKESE